VRKSQRKRSLCNTAYCTRNSEDQMEVSITRATYLHSGLYLRSSTYYNKSWIVRRPGTIRSELGKAELQYVVNNCCYNWLTTTTKLHQIKNIAMLGQFVQFNIALMSRHVMSLTYVWNVRWYTLSASAWLLYVIVKIVSFSMSGILYDQTASFSRAGICHGQNCLFQLVWNIKWS
jgi:hypothetical protein